MAGDVGDEAAEQVLNLVISLLKWMARESRSAARSGINALKEQRRTRNAAEQAAREVRADAENSYNNDFADEYATDVSPDIPDENSPVIEFTTRPSDPEGDILTGWLDRAKIPYAADEATVPPCSIITVAEKDITDAKRVLEEARIAQVDIMSLGKGALAVNFDDAKAASAALKKEGIEHSKPEYIEGLVAVRVHDENLRPALNLIDKAIVAGIPGITLERFVNLEDLHEQAGLAMPDFRISNLDDFESDISDPEKAADRTGRIEPEVNIDDIESYIEPTSTYVYPHSEAELEYLCSVLDTDNIKNEVICSDKFTKGGFFAAAINYDDLQTRLASLPEDDAKELGDIVYGNTNPIQTRNDILNSEVADNLVERAAGEVSQRDISQSKDVLTTTFTTVPWDKSGEIFSGRLEKANIPYDSQASLRVSFSVADAEKVFDKTKNLLEANNIPAPELSTLSSSETCSIDFIGTKNTTIGEEFTGILTKNNITFNEQNTIEVAFASENAPQVCGVVDTLLNQNIKGLDQSRFPQLEELRQTSDLFSFESDIDNSPYVTKVVEDTSVLNLVCEALLTNGVQFNSDNHTLSVNVASLEAAGGVDPLENYIDGIRHPEQAAPRRGATKTADIRLSAEARSSLNQRQTIDFEAQAQAAKEIAHSLSREKELSPLEQKQSVKR